MRPKDLKPLYTWDTRCVKIEDRILYVPKYFNDYQTFEFPGWKDAAVFGNPNPVHLEYCSGNGDWIIDKARTHPDWNWVAVEIRFDRVRKIWSKMKNYQLNNVFIVCGEAHTATHHYFQKESVDQIYINFPDPWPKARHAKHRLMHPQFVEEMQRIMKSEAAITFVTDDPDYSELSIDILQKTLRSKFPKPHFVTQFPNYGSSYFEKLWKDKGKKIRYHQFLKIGD